MERQALLAWCKETYGTTPEYLWVSHPSYAVLRHTGNQKWYATVMDVPRARLGLPGTGSVDVVNVKTDPLLAGSLRLNPGVLPGYHMNKSCWLSLLLDGTVTDELVLALLADSHCLTAPKPPRKPARRAKA